MMNMDGLMAMGREMGRMRLRKGRDAGAGCDLHRRRVPDGADCREGRRVRDLGLDLGKLGTFSGSAAAGGHTLSTSAYLIHY